MIWWCSARGIPWDGSWQAYPGVWLFCIAFGMALWALRPAHLSFGWRHAAILGGAILLWLTLDWPVGPLGAGYLVWVHTGQFLMLAMLIPPLVLLGVDRQAIARALERRPAVLRAVAAVTQPVFAIVVFAVTMVLTHLPPVVDGLMASQAGAFALDMLWLLAGLIFWWPVIVRVPEREHFPPLLQMLYLFFGTQPHLLIAMWLLAADFPVYATYELAPRATGLSAVIDQQIGGAIMLGFGATYILGAITVLFFRWSAQSREA